MGAVVDALIGVTVGNYQIVRLLGRGGMGSVYEGVQPSIGSRVAIKVIAEQYAHDADLVQRFLSEARAVNLIRHERIVNVFDLLQLQDGRPVIVMELLEGRTLGDVVRVGPVMLGGLAIAMLDVLDVLAVAHEHSIVHRDLKPDNIFITNTGRAKVLDFGVAKLLAVAADQAHPRTRSGIVLGTPSYMAPEQIVGGAVEPASDLYALGVVMFEAVTGRRPFTGESDFQVLRAHVDSDPPSPRTLRPELPPELSAVILTALAKRPRDRYRSAREMARALHDATVTLPDVHWCSLAPDGGPAMRPPVPREATGTAPMSPRDGEPTVRATPGARKRPRRRGWLLALAAVAVALAGGTVAVALVRSSADRPAPPPPAPLQTIANAPPIDAAPQSAFALDAEAVPDAAAPPAHVVVHAPAPSRPARAPADAAVAVAPASDTFVTSDAVDGHEVVGYALAARDQARKLSADADLVGIYIGTIMPSGEFDPGMAKVRDYVFRSPSFAAPKCLIVVSLTADGRALVHRAEGKCNEKFVPFPKCSLDAIWARAANDPQVRTIDRFRGAFVQWLGVWVVKGSHYPVRPSELDPLHPDPNIHDIDYVPQEIYVELGDHC